MNRNTPSQTNYRRHDETEAFTMVSNAAWKDKALSLEAKGLLISLVVLPKDWMFNRTWAMREFDIGRDKLDRILGELRDAGYIVYVRPRDEMGKVQAGHYLYAANPESLAKAKTSQESGNHNPENPPAGKNHPLVDPAAGKPSRRKTWGTYKRKNPTKKKNEQKSASGAGENFSPEEVSPAAAPCPSPSAAPAAAPEPDWRRRLALYRKNGNWAPAGRWGPPMHAPGCLVPAELVKLWDDTQGNAFKEEAAKPAWQNRKKRNWQQASSAIN